MGLRAHHYAARPQASKLLGAEVQTSLINNHRKRRVQPHDVASMDMVAGLRQTRMENDAAISCGRCDRSKLPPCRFVRLQVCDGRPHGATGLVSPCHEFATAHHKEGTCLSPAGSRERHVDMFEVFCRGVVNDRRGISLSGDHADDKKESQDQSQDQNGRREPSRYPPAPHRPES
jgi:hypothetical protein